MALSDINFQEGEGQDFIVEIPTAVYTGSLTDINLEQGGVQCILHELPEVIGGGGNVFIIND